MNKRDEMILARTRRHHPKLVDRMKTILSMGGSMGGFDVLLEIAFEAGREFQAGNPHLELSDPKAYTAAPAAMSA